MRSDVHRDGAGGTGGARLKGLVIGGAAAFCVALGMWVGALNGVAYGVAAVVFEALVVGLFVTAVWSGWRVVAAVAAFLALMVVAAPVACVTSQPVGASDTTTSCTSFVGLPLLVGLPLMALAPVAAWVLAARGEHR